MERKTVKEMVAPDNCTLKMKKNLCTMASKYEVKCVKQRNEMFLFFQI